MTKRELTVGDVVQQDGIYRQVRLGDTARRAGVRHAGRAK